MKNNLLTPQHAQWLAGTLERRLGKTSLRMEATGEEGGGDGFPANTPVKDMTTEQQAAYYKHQSSRHEERNKELLRITGGKYGDDLKAEIDELATLRDKTRTDAERAVEEAKQQGAKDGVSKLASSAARTAFEFALGHDPEANDMSTLIDTLDLSKVLSDDGTVDAAKVRTVVGQIAPADKGAGNHRDADYGAGRRTNKPGKPGEAGVSEAERRFGKRD